MTNTELIRQEIERRIGAMYNFSSGYSALNVCRELLDFIDSLPKESVTDCHELEEAAMQAYPSQEQVIVTAFGKLTIDKFRPERDAFIAGANWQKEQMKEEAIEASCFGGKDGDKYLVNFVADYDKVRDYNLGRKGKIYIFKEEKK